jgi:hypothetical protein
MDSSAAYVIIRPKNLIVKQYSIQLIAFVTGFKDGFPMEYKLREHLSPPTTSQENPTHFLKEKVAGHIRSQ